MAYFLSGVEAAKAITENLRGQVEAMAGQPCLATVRMSNKDADVSYELSILKRCQKAGIEVRQVVIAEDAPEEELLNWTCALNANREVHGILVFRPLPKHIDENAVRRALASHKDVDGITDRNIANLYSGNNRSCLFPPCTAEGCVALLKHYQIPIEGKHVVIVGRSMVVGKPLAMLMLQENATVTICHSRTENLPAICQGADILVVAAGKAGLIGAEHVRPGQVILDVGINTDAEGKLCGDVRFEEVKNIVKAITPVPGGVGSMTTAILASHVVKAAEKMIGR